MIHRQGNLRGAVVEVVEGEVFRPVLEGSHHGGVVVEVVEVVFFLGEGEGEDSEEAYDEGHLSWEEVGNDKLGEVCDEASSSGVERYGSHA